MNLTPHRKVWVHVECMLIIRTCWSFKICQLSQESVKARCTDDLKASRVIYF